MQRIPSLLSISRREALLGLAAAGLCGQAHAAADETIAFDGLYKSFGVLGFQFSDRVTALRGQSVRMPGCMKIAGTSLKPLELWRSDVHLGDALDFARALAAGATEIFPVGVLVSLVSAALPRNSRFLAAARA